jgi:uncharacterized membrane protein
MQERRIHQIFEVSVVLKGIHALIECVGGLMLAFVSTASITHLVVNLTQDDFVEDHFDAVATHLQAWANGFSLQAQHFYAFYLLSHGIVKIALVIGLLRAKLWAYPASIVVMSLFIAYQVYRYTYTHGVGLIILTLFDLILIGLVWHEYRLMRDHLPVK